MIVNCGLLLSDLLQHQRLLPQAAAQVTAGVHGEVLHHHLVDELLQLAQLRAQVSAGGARRDANRVQAGVCKASWIQLIFNAIHFSCYMIV